jgi:hypothetical protein
MDGAAAQKEQRCRGGACGEDLFARLVGLD